MCSFNPNGVVSRDIQWSQRQGSLLNIQHVDQSRAVKKGFKYMFQKLADKSAGWLDYTVPGGDRPSLTH